jgi:hypothetical protein
VPSVAEAGLAVLLTRVNGTRNFWAIVNRYPITRTLYASFAGAAAKLTVTVEVFV